MGFGDRRAVPAHLGRDGLGGMTQYWERPSSRQSSVTRIVWSRLAWRASGHA